MSPSNTPADAHGLLDELLAGGPVDRDGREHLQFVLLAQVLACARGQDSQSSHMIEYVATFATHFMVFYEV